VYVIGLHFGYQVLHPSALCPFLNKISFSAVNIGHGPWAWAKDTGSKYE